MTGNDRGWKTIFEQLPIMETIDAGDHFDITAVQIKQISGREPRIMTKIDFRERLPRIMAANNLAILAISNGTYRIGRFDPFLDIQPLDLATIVPEKVIFPDTCLTLDPKRLATESAVLEAALLTGMLKRVFGEHVALTIRGRSRHPNFHFSLGNIDFPVSGVQVEVDGGYEGATTVNLVEAKIGPRNNLSVRQILYPQLAWKSVLMGRKEVRAYACFFEEPWIRFIPIAIENNTCRADHARETVFTLVSSSPEPALDLGAIPAHPDAPLPRRDAPFPQADIFSTVMAMFDIVAREGEITKEELAQEFDIVSRQIAYYVSALVWLGLVDVSRRGTIISLTPDGRTLSDLPHAKRHMRLASTIFSEPIFHHVLHKGPDLVPTAWFNRWKCPSESTRTRRLKTVLSWVSYFQAIAKQEAR